MFVQERVAPNPRGECRRLTYARCAWKALEYTSRSSGCPVPIDITLAASFPGSPITLIARVAEQRFPLWNCSLKPR
ncbi:hypothetical protein KSP39_PZI015406 [Platanthera zijinensis]|uniref:Uncharacterized protein n=1 Tax=Platanthera zijinensis TaxID=2320716 RepID=A0AAP0B9T4_9ASPA